MHPGSPFLGLSLFELSCSSNSQPKQTVDDLWENLQWVDGRLIFNQPSDDVGAIFLVVMDHCGEFRREGGSNQRGP
jgi:hypothetical protein